MAALAIVIGLTLAWNFTPLSEFLDSKTIEAAMTGFASSTWAPAYVVGAFLLGGLLAFPLILLIAGTAAAFGPVLGFAYAAAGSLASALLTYFLRCLARTRHVGKRARPTPQPHPRAYSAQRHSCCCRHQAGSDCTIYHRQHGRRSERDCPSHYMLGTALGLLPGLLMLSAIGSQVMDIVFNPSLGVGSARCRHCRLDPVGTRCTDTARSVAGRGAVTASSRSTVRVMTWNIHGGIGPDGLHDLERMLAVVQRADPDILALQEVNSRRVKGAEHPIALLKRVLGHHGIAAAAITTADGDYGQVLLSRWPLKTQSSMIFRYPAASRVGRSRPPSIRRQDVCSSWPHI